MASLIGHRGAPRLAPENTLASFRAALGAGVDGLELDLHRTNDGVLAVHHDPDVEGAFITDLSWAELSTRAPLVPRFEQVLELLEEFPSARLNIELKHAVPKADGREELLVRALERWRGPAKDRAWISTFDPFAILRLEQEAAPLPLALLVGEEVALDLLPCLPVAGVHPHHSLVSEERLAGWHERGLFVFAWTINDAELASRLLAWGADGIIGDDPELMLEASGRGVA
ncbi:MAG TPA: glycerophosphodiester phosphodiesterase [Trueperaceae bacterium]